MLADDIVWLRRVYHAATRMTRYKIPGSAFLCGKESRTGFVLAQKGHLEYTRDKLKLLENPALLLSDMNCLTTWLPDIITDDGYIFKELGATNNDAT